MKRNLPPVYLLSNMISRIFEAASRSVSSCLENNSLLIAGASTLTMISAMRWLSRPEYTRGLARQVLLTAPMGNRIRSLSKTTLHLWHNLVEPWCRISIIIRGYWEAWNVSRSASPRAAAPTTFPVVCCCADKGKEGIVDIPSWFWFHSRLFNSFLLWRINRKKARTCKLSKRVTKPRAQNYVVGFLTTMADWQLKALQVCGYPKPLIKHQICWLEKTLSRTFTHTSWECYFGKLSLTTRLLKWKAISSITHEMSSQIYFDWVKQSIRINNKKYYFIKKIILKISWYQSSAMAKARSKYFYVSFNTFTNILWLQHSANKKMQSLSTTNNSVFTKAACNLNKLTAVRLPRIVVYLCNFADLCSWRYCLGISTSAQPPLSVAQTWRSGVITLIKKTKEQTLL